MDKTAFAARCTALLFSLVSAAAVAAPPKDWNIAALGALPSQIPFSTAYGVNNRGDIVGSSNVYDPALRAHRTYAIVWQNGRMQNLGEGYAMAVNDHGTVVASISGMGGLSLWKDGELTRLGIVGWAFAINKFNAIAGWGGTTGFMYRNGVMLDLGALGGSESSASGMNDRGQVVGYAKVPGNNNYHAFLWEGGVMKDLGTLGGGSESRAQAINNHGVVVGEAWTSRGVRPFIYDGVMRELFTESFGVVPRAINDRGAVVGTMEGNASFLFDDGVLTRLEAIPAVRDAGWTQLIPYDINDLGWIVGMGRMGPLQPPATQEWKAFVLKPREKAPGPDRR